MSSRMSKQGRKKPTASTVEGTVGELNMTQRPDFLRTTEKLSLSNLNLSSLGKEVMVDLSYGL